MLLFLKEVVNSPYTYNDTKWLVDVYVWMKNVSAWCKTM